MKNKMTQQHFQLKSVGIVHSELKDVRDCPHQEREGAPGAWIEIEPQYADALGRAGGRGRDPGFHLDAFGRPFQIAGASQREQEIIR